MSISSMTPDSITALSVNRTMPAAGKQQLEKIAGLKRQVAEADRAIRAAEQRIQTLSGDQDRLRQNIQSLNSIAGQQDTVQRYARDLAAREQQIVTLRDQAAEQRTRKGALESEIHGLLEKLEF
jgi:chromosome segregation ATPase